MLATLKPQDFRLVLNVTRARITKIQDLTAETVRIKVEFLATHWCKKEMQLVTPEGETEPVEQEIEVQTLMATTISVDEKEQEIPYELWDALYRAIGTPAIIEAINPQLEAFNALFYGSMEGFNLQLETIELG